MQKHTTQDSEVPLKVLVVGAGLAGLAVAIALRRQGHHVEIFEASRFANDVGAGITIPPNAARSLKELGVGVRQLRGVEWRGLSVCFHDGTMKRDIINSETPGEFPYALMVYRVDLHNVLKETAMSEDGLGIPIKLHLQSGVKSCDPEQGIIILKNGETHQGDVIIGADGIRSTIRTSVIGKVHVAPSAGLAAFRWVADSTKIKSDPILSWVTGEGPQGPRMVFERTGGHRTILTYPCSNGEFYNVTIPFIDERDQNAVEWTVPTTVDYILKKLEDYDPKFVEYLKLAENPKIWQMRSLGVLPTWINGRVCLAGDAAHSMLPILGQGAAQAMEDAVTLGVVLSRGTKREEVPSKLELYQQARKEHAEFVQKFSLDHVFSYETGTGTEEIIKAIAQVTQYDALKHAQDVVKEQTKA